MSALDPAELAAALAEVVADADLRERMVRAGRARAACFTWDAAAEQLWAAARSVADGAGPPGPDRALRRR